MAALVVNLQKLTVAGAVDLQVNFNDDVADSNGTKWWLMDLDGWDSPDTRQSLFEKTGHDGMMMGESQYGARGVVLKGIAKTAGEAGYYASRYKLARVTDAKRNNARLIVAETDTTKRMLVSRSGKVQMEWGRGAFAFQVPLVSTDSRKYDDAEQSVAGTAAVPDTSTTPTTYTYYTPVLSTPNNGIVSTPWKATITASSWPGGTLHVYDPDDNIPRLQLAGVPAMTGADALVIDSFDRSIKFNGTNRYDLLTRTSLRWDWLLPGTNKMQAYRADGNGSLTLAVAWRPAWL